MSTNINSTEQIVEINAGDQITNINLVSQSTTQVVSGEQVVTIDVNAGTIPAAWGSITGTLSNQTDLQNALNAKQNNITLTTTGTTGVATLVGATLNIPNYVTSTKQTEWDSAYNDKITSAEVSGTTTKTLTLNQQDGGTITASWSDFDTAPVTSVFGRTGDIVATEGDYNIGQMGDVTITSASNGQVLKYNGTAWVNAADASGLTSVGLAMPSAFTVSGSPLTSNGTITVTGSGTTAQYVRGDGSLATFPSISQEALRLISEVYNQTGATLTKGTIVYINGAHGNLPTVTKAIATSDPTSAQTFGFVQSDITNNNNGYIVIAGKLTGLDTQGIAEGTQLYLSPTVAGGYTTTKQYAPNHLVYVGIVNRAHPTQGEIEVKIQNGYELDEIHDVSATNKTNKDGIFYNSTTGLWEAKTIEENLGYTPVPQSRIITINGTAQDLSADRTYNVGTVTNVAASGGTGISIGGSPVTGSGTITITNTAPDQVVSLTGAGTTTTSGTYPNFTITSNDQYVGTVTSVNATVPTGFEVSGVPITSSGTVDIKFASGYSLPTNAKQTQWDTAYTKRLDSLTVTGSSGSATLTSNVLNVPTYTLAGLGGEPAITAGTSLQYFRGDKSFQTLDTSVVPENGAIYFTEPRVRATVLSGMNITGGAITASDNILNAFGKVQNQINGLIGGSIFQSTWNASTNTPTLTSSVGIKGYYYIVSTAGTTNLDGITDWQMGDWAIFDGTVWRKVDNTDAVVSVNGYTGIVSLVLDDLADVSAASPTDTQLLRFNGTTSKWYNWTPTFLNSLNGITNATQTFATGTSGTDFNISSSGSTHTFNIPTASATNRGALSSADWTTFNDKQNALSGTINTIAYWNSATSIASLALATYPSLTELSYVKGVTSAIQTQINGKQASGNYVTTDTTQTITSRKTISYQAASYGGTTQSLLIDGAAGDGALTINSVTTGYAYQTFSQNGVGKFEIGIVGTSGNGSLYINSNIQTGETGASIYIKKSNGYVGILNIDPTYPLDVSQSVNAHTGIRNRNTSTGTGAVSTFTLANNATDLGAGIGLFGGNFTSTGQYRANGMYVFSNQSGGLTLHAEGANSMYLATNNVTALTINSSQAATFSSTLQINGKTTITTSDSHPLLLNGSSNQYLHINSGAFEAMTRYQNPTAGSWYTGIRTSAGIADTASYHIFSTTLGDDVFALTTAGNAIVAGSIKASISALGTPATAFLVSDSGTIKSRTAAQVLSDISALTTNFDTTGTLRARTAKTTYRGNIGNPATDAPIRSLTNAEDNWIYLDSASTEWGIYHRNIDSNLVVAGQPTLKANSIGFVGANSLQAYICLADGEILAKSFVKYNGTSSQFLKADGSVDSNTYVTTDTTQTIASRKTISLEAASYGGTTQSLLIDGAAGNAALTINAASAYAYLNFAQAGTTKIEIGCEGAVTNKGSLYINSNIQVGSTGASIFIKKSNGFVGINGIDPQANLHVYNNSDVWHTIIGGASGELRIGGQAGSGAVIQARNNAGTTRPLYLQRDGANVIINGTADSGDRLQVNGSTQLSGQTTITSSSQTPLILNGSSNQYLYISSGYAEAMTRYYNPTAGNWYTGIRTSAGLGATSSYHIYSSTYGNDVFVLTVAGNAVVAGGYFESSDRRLKTNIENFNSSDILNVSAKIYEKFGQIEVGYIAQEIQGIIPSAVTLREDGYLDLSYRQVHTAKIAALETEIKQLKNKLNELVR